MANEINLNIEECWRGGVPHGGIVDMTSNPSVETGSGTPETSTSVTRMKIVTPPFLEEGKAINLIVRVTPSANVNYRSSSSTMAISEVAYGLQEITEFFGYDANNFSKALQECKQSKVSNSKDQFVISSINLKPNQTYYLYFARVGAGPIYNAKNEYQGYTGLFQSSSASVVIEVPDLNELSDPIITSTSKIVKPSQSITASWKASTSSGEGLSNSVLKYQVTIKTESQTLKTTTTTSTSYTYFTSGLARGTKIKISVQAISKYDQYKNNANYKDYLSACNSETITGDLGSINQLPDTPSCAESSFTVAGEAPTNITIVHGDDKDGNNQTRYIYYEIGNSGKTRASGGKISLTLSSLRGVGITDTGDYTLKAYTYDGLEYSSEPLNITITAKFAPVIKGEPKVEQIKVTSRKGVASSILKQIKISFELEYNFTSDLTASVWINDQTNALNKGVTFNYSKVTKTILIEVKDIVELIPNATTFTVSFQINNQGGSSGKITLEGSFKKPLKLELLSFSIANDADPDITENSDDWSNYFKSKVRVTYKFDEKDEVFDEEATWQPENANIFLYISDSGEYNSENKKTPRRVTLTTRQGNHSGNLNMTYAYTYPIKFKLQIIDSIGQTIDSDWTEEFDKIDAPTFSGGIFKVDTNIFNPNIEGSSFNFTHPKAVCQVSQVSEKYEYSYKLLVGGETIELNPGKTGDSNVPDHYDEILNNNTTITINSKTDFNTELINTLDNATNFEGVGTLQIIVKDIVFNQIITYTPASGASFTITLRTPPAWPDDPKLSLLHDYVRSRDLNSETIEAIIKESAEVVIDSTMNKQTQVFNPNEGIVFKFPIPTDVNGDLSSFVIYYYKADSKKSSVFESENFQTIIIDINNTKLVNYDENYYYRLPASKNDDGNKYYYYGIQAVDTQGKTSSILYFKDDSHKSNSCIICARTVASTITISNFSSNFESDNLTLNFDLEIDELGGSKTLISDYDQKKYYTSYPNFDRFFNGANESSWSRKIKVVISNNINFEDNGSEKKTKSPIERMVSSYDNNSPLYFYSGQSFTFQGIDWPRIYVKITFEVTPDNPTYTNKKYIVSVPHLETVYSAVPTVAHRANRVGINVREVDENCALVVGPYGSHTQVVFTDNADLSAANIKIIINLENGTISGASISGGSW